LPGVPQEQGITGESRRCFPGGEAFSARAPKNAPVRVLVIRGLGIFYHGSLWGKRMTIIVSTAAPALASLPCPGYTEVCRRPLFRGSTTPGPGPNYRGEGQGTRERSRSKQSPCRRWAFLKFYVGKYRHLGQGISGNYKIITLGCIILASVLSPFAPPTSPDIRRPTGIKWEKSGVQAGNRIGPSAF